MPPCLWILENKTMSASIGNNMFGWRCFSRNSGLCSHFPAALPRVQMYHRDSGWRSVCNASWPAVMRGPGLGSNHFVGVPLGQLKKKRETDLVILKRAPAGVHVNNHNTWGLISLHEWMAEIGSASMSIVSASSTSLVGNVFLIRNTINKLTQQRTWRP